MANLIWVHFFRVVSRPHHRPSGFGSYARAAVRTSNVVVVVRRWTISTLTHQVLQKRFGQRFASAWVLFFVLVPTRLLFASHLEPLTSSFWCLCVFVFRVSFSYCARQRRKNDITPNQLADQRVFVCLFGTARHFWRTQIIVLGFCLATHPGPDVGFIIIYFGGCALW